MTTFKIAVQIGAALSSGFTSAMKGSAAQLHQLGSSIQSLKQQQASIKKVELGEASVGKARIAYQAAVKDVVRLRREVANTTEPNEKLNQSFTRAKEKADRLSTSLGKQRDRLQQARNALKKTGLSTDDLTGDNRRLGQSVEQLNRQYGRLGKSMRAQQAIQKKRNELRGQLFDAVALGATVAAPLTIAVNFEQSVAKLGSITSTGNEAIDAENLAALENQARQLGESTQFSASQAVGAQTFLGMAGFNPDQIVGATAGVLNLAQAAGADLSDTADIASNILSGFALDATKDMGRVGDVLTATFTTSNTTLQSLGETLQYVAPVASSAGGSIEQVAAMVGLLGDVGIQGSKAGTALRATFLRLSAPTGGAAKALSQLGVDVADMDGNLRPVPALLKDLSFAMDGMGTTQQTGFIKQIFGEEAASGVTALLTQASSGSLDTEIATLQQAQGTADKIASKMSATTLGSLKRLGSALESVAISVGSLLLPILATGAEFFAGIASGVSTLANEFPLLTTVVVGATTGLIALRVATIAGSFAYTFMAGGVLSLKTAYLALSSGLLLTKTRLGMMNALGAATAVRLGIVTAAQWAWNVALTANPIGIIIVGIGALIGAGVLLVKNWDKVKSFFVGLWENIKKITGPAVNWLVGKVQFLLAPIKLLMKAKDALFGSIGKFFGGDDETEISVGQSESTVANNNTATNPVGDVIKPSSELLPSNPVGDVINTSKEFPPELDSTIRQVNTASVNHTAQSVINAPITVNAAPGMDATEVAQQVQLALDEREQRTRTDRRSVLFDETVLLSGSA